MHPDVIAKYAGARIPRYTSYPTAPHFSPAVGAETYRGWLGGIEPGMSLSLYVHVPFCRQMCWYCGCHTKITRRDAPVADYVAALGQEVDLIAGLLPASCRVGQIHWGGGTPTIVGARAFAGLMDRVRQRFAFAPGAEVAAEIDPRTVDRDMIGELAAAGLNRASLGVQTFDPAVQRAINRVQGFAETQAVVAALREHGVTGVNLDLIYGLPRQTAAACVDTVDRIGALSPDRLAVFGYAHVPWMKSHQRMIDEQSLPGEHERARQFTAIVSALTERGYMRIGLDHFANPNDPLAQSLADGTLRRNFQGYTTDRGDVLIGLGASAISQLPQGYVQNTVAIADYSRKVTAGALAAAKGIACSADDHLRRDVIERVMCFQRADLAAAGRKHGFGDGWWQGLLPTLAALEADGVIRRQGAEIAIVDDAWLLMRSVAAVFDSYLTAGGQRHARAV